MTENMVSRLEEDLPDEVKAYGKAVLDGNVDVAQLAELARNAVRAGDSRRLRGLGSEVLDQERLAEARRECGVGLDAAVQKPQKDMTAVMLSVLEQRRQVFCPLPVYLQPPDAL